MRLLSGLESTGLAESGAAATGADAARLDATCADLALACVASRRELGGGGASVDAALGAEAAGPGASTGASVALGTGAESLADTSADGTVDGVRSLFAPAGAWDAVSGRTDTGGGVLVIEDGRGAALTDGTLGGTLVAARRGLTAAPALAGATLEDCDVGATLAVPRPVVIGGFGVGATLGADRVDSGGLGVPATDAAGRTLAAERTLGGAGGEFTREDGLGDAAGFAADGAAPLFACAASEFGAGFSATGSSSSQPESMSSSEAPMPHKGTSRRDGYGSDRRNGAECAMFSEANSRKREACRNLFTCTVVPCQTFCQGFG